MPVSSIEVKVKEHFDNTDTYLAGNDGILVRQETVNYFLRDHSYTDILDIACGNGMVSIPLLKENINLTLLDISENMIQIALGQVPDAWKNRVVAISKSINEVELPSSTFDVVLCIGLLAHVPSPYQTIGKAMSWVKPGGHLIVQSTDQRHPYSWFVLHLIDTLKAGLGFKTYRLSRISVRSLKSYIENHGFEMMDSFSYIISYPLVSRFLSRGRMYRLIRRVFGDAERKRNQWLGNDSIMHFINQS